jgi:hypothetical protein
LLCFPPPPPPLHKDLIHRKCNFINSSRYNIRKNIRKKGDGRMKKLCVLLLLFAAGNLCALDGFFAGLGAEANANTRKGAALGGLLTLGLDINDIFAAGAKATFSSNLDTVSTLETAGFFRYYFSRLLPLPLGILFAQAEVGASLFFEEGETYPAFYGGLAAGWRFNAWKGLYLEPLVRAGYPCIWGVGLSVGYRFDINTPSSEGQ